MDGRVERPGGARVWSPGPPPGQLRMIRTDLIGRRRGLIGRVRDKTPKGVLCDHCPFAGPASLWRTRVLVVSWRRASTRTQGGSPPAGDACLWQEAPLRFSGYCSLREVLRTDLGGPVGPKAMDKRAKEYALMQSNEDIYDTDNDYAGSCFTR